MGRHSAVKDINRYALRPYVVDDGRSCAVRDRGRNALRVNEPGVSGRLVIRTLYVPVMFGPGAAA